MLLVVGLMLVGAPFTVVCLYLVLEWLFRKQMADVFAGALATVMPRSVRIKVLPKMLVVSLMIGTIPIAIISYICLS